MREAKINEMRKRQLNTQRKVDTRRREIGRPHRRKVVTVQNSSTQDGQLNTGTLAGMRRPGRDSDKKK